MLSVRHRDSEAQVTIPWLGAAVREQQQFPAAGQYGHCRL